MRHLAANLGDVVNLNCNSLHVGSPKANINSSPYPLSSINHHIPTSGRSTPTPYSPSIDPKYSFTPSNVAAHVPASNRLSSPFPDSFDFGSPFDSPVSLVRFDLTPASSATSPSPMAPKTHNASNLIYPVFPIIPSGGRHDLFGQSLGVYDTQQTPSQTMDCALFASYLRPDSRLLSPPVITQFDHMSNIVTHRVFSDNAIDPNQQLPTALVETNQSIGQNEGSLTIPLIPSNTEKERFLVGDPRQGTPGLQQVQRCSQINWRARIKREGKRRSVRACDSNVALDSVRPTKPYKCHVEGCIKSYRRNEHVKRHIQTAHGQTTFPCPFCNHVANRRDNYMSHLKLHTKPRAGKPRVTFSGDAVEEFAKEKSKNRRRRSSKLIEQLDE
ncbi:hypothetical protein C7999DRAFT_14684 [Corynascus novoguineensis]|uniref:C2H2-type domain-containing protein n=1 Tax=Corynascus novoguineensis TaxID=1126955 RepID=A0AAN7CS16_9PEZI|nr:hypothetical protein C7999DRAFT_14684 [Corynascus novoguineensis]